MGQVLIDLEELRKDLLMRPEHERADYLLEMFRFFSRGIIEAPWATKAPAVRACPKAYSEHFLLFWREYPRKTNKGGAWKAFWGACQSFFQGDQDKATHAMLNALEWQKESEDHLDRDEQFIPHAQTWLNGRRWEDENPDESGEWVTNLNGQRVRK